MDVSIVIVNWNTRSILRDCLRTVYDYSGAVDFEVIVVDNASTDGSCKMVEEEFPRVILVVNDENRGFAAANNQGIRLAQGRYVLLLNSDTLVMENAIERTVTFADANGRTAVVACRILNHDGSLQPSCSTLPALCDRFLFAAGLTHLFPRSRLLARPSMHWWGHDSAREVEVVSGCFMLVRREAIDQVGLLDERFFMYCEEVDWCKRFREAGWQILFTPAGQIVHLGGGSATRYSARRATIKDASTVQYMFKHWTKTRACLGVLAMMLFYATRIVVWLPFRVLGKHKDQFDNHCAGLKGLLCYRRYLPEQQAQS